MSAGEPNTYSSEGIVLPTFDDYPYSTLNEDERIHATAWFSYGRRSRDSEIAALTEKMGRVNNLSEIRLGVINALTEKLRVSEEARVKAEAACASLKHDANILLQLLMAHQENTGEFLEADDASIVNEIEPRLRIDSPNPGQSILDRLKAAEEAMLTAQRICSESLKTGEKLISSMCPHADGCAWLIDSTKCDCGYVEAFAAYAATRRTR